MLHTHKTGSHMASILPFMRDKSDFDTGVNRNPKPYDADPRLNQRDTMALEARVMPYGTIIFIALIMVVACSLLYWLSALCGDYSHPKRDGKAPKKHPLSNWK